MQCSLSCCVSSTCLLFILIRIGFLSSLYIRFSPAVSVYSSLLFRVDGYRGHSHADLRTRTGLQLLQVLHRRRLIRKHVEARGSIFGELNPAIGEPVIEPMGGDTKPPGELGDGQRPGHMSRMRLMPLLHAAMLEPESS